MIHLHIIIATSFTLFRSQQVYSYSHHWLIMWLLTSEAKATFTLCPLVATPPESYGHQHPPHLVCDHRPADQQQFKEKGVPSAAVDNCPDKTEYQPTPRGGTSWDSWTMWLWGLIIRKHLACWKLTLMHTSVKCTTYIPHPYLSVHSWVDNSICIPFNAFTHTLTLFF